MIDRGHIVGTQTLIVIHALFVLPRLETDLGCLSGFNCKLTYSHTSTRIE